MEVITELGARGGPVAGTAVTIGAFDGVHRGHQAVLAELRRLATEAGLSTTVVTFDRHPAMVVRPESAPKLLTDLDQKLEALAATGHVDATVVVPFDEARSKEDPEDFVSEVLVDGLGARLVIVGEDFHFGHRRRGNVELLRRLGADLGFEVVGLGLIEAPGDWGWGRCRPPPSGASCLPATSPPLPTCSGATTRCGGWWPAERGGATTSASRRPTWWWLARSCCRPSASTPAGTGGPTGPCTPLPSPWAGARPSIPTTPPIVLEPYLLDFTGDLYGEAARVSFVARLRDEERFDSVDALKAQIALDVEATRKALVTD